MADKTPTATGSVIWGIGALAIILTILVVLWRLGGLVCVRLGDWSPEARLGVSIIAAAVLHALISRGGRR